MYAHHVLGSNIETGRGSSYFGDLCMLGLVWNDIGKNLEGVKLVDPKIDFLRFCACCVFGARQFFETTFDHIENFCILQIFHIVSHFL